MRKRLRKKKHLGEFREYGMHLLVRFHPGSDWERFLDDFIDLAEANAMRCGGGTDAQQLDLFVELGRQADDPPRRRSLVLDWLRQRAEVAAVEAGAIVDAWYGF